MYNNLSFLKDAVYPIHRLLSYTSRLTATVLLCPPPFHPGGEISRKKKLEIENKLNGNSNLNHSMVKADVKRSRYIVSKCSIIASIIKVVTNFSIPTKITTVQTRNQSYSTRTTNDHRFWASWGIKVWIPTGFANIENPKNKKKNKNKKDVPVARRWYTESIRMDGESAERLSVTCSPASTSRSTGSLRWRKTREIPQRWK